MTRCSALCALAFFAFPLGASAQRGDHHGEGDEHRSPQGQAAVATHAGGGEDEDPTTDEAEGEHGEADHEGEHGASDEADHGEHGADDRGAAEAHGGTHGEGHGREDERAAQWHAHARALGLDPEHDSPQAIDAETRAELARHARRVAQINRIQQLSTELTRPELAERAARLLETETARNTRNLARIASHRGGAAPTTPAADPTAAPSATDVPTATTTAEVH